MKRKTLRAQRVVNGRVQRELEVIAAAMTGLSIRVEKLVKELKRTHGTAKKELE